MCVFQSSALEVTKRAGQCSSLANGHVCADPLIGNYTMRSGFKGSNKIGVFSIFPADSVRQKY